MAQNLPDFKQGKVLVIGDVILDRYWSGSTSRISPEAPVPVVNIQQIEDRPGGAANVALNSHTLGTKTFLCGLIGNDEAGKALSKLLNAAGVQNQFHVNNDKPTITKLRVLSQHQQLIRLDFEDQAEDQSKAKPNTFLHDSVKNKLNEIDVLVMSDYAKGALSQTQEIINLCRKASIKIIVDPKGNDFTRYRNASVITPNLRELEVIIGRCADKQELANKAEALRADLNLDAIMVTMGEQGVALIQKDNQPKFVSAKTREVFDVTGAGDTVIAAFSSAIASQCDYETAMHIANAAAGVVVGKLGTSTVNLEELSEALNLKPETVESNDFNIEVLLEKVKQARSSGEKIVFTNGCFDLLHAGHVQYLKSAANLGSKLIVAVNSDASVRKLKGESRPINSIERRILVLSALNCVDWVIPFDEDTPLRLIEQIQPDYLVKGGDYTKEEVVGYETVTLRGGEVVIMPFYDGLSTSNTIKKLRSNV